MKDTLQAGLTDTATYRVTPEMGPPHLDVVVLSTPWLLALVEMTSLRAISAHLDDGETIVGTGARLTHDAVAHAGEDVVVVSTLVAVGRRLTFDAHVTGPRGTVGTVELQSAVIDTARFARPPAAR